MSDDLLRVEGAVTATSSGNLTWELWTHDCAVALGFAGQRNPLGFAVVRYIEGTDSHGSSASMAWGLALQLATVLIKRGHDKVKANDTAWRSIHAWNQSKCGHCLGRGVVSFEQKGCTVCAGTGDSPIDDLPAEIRDGISALIEAEQWMERQLRARLGRES